MATTKKSTNAAKSSKTATKKSAAKKAPSKKVKPGNKYSPAASASVEREMKAMEQGTLRTSAGDKVTNPKQAIAIGLSEARREGDEMPPPPERPARTAPANKPKKKATKKSGNS